MIPIMAGIAAAAHAFEGSALGQLFAPMFATVDTSGGPFGGGTGESAWRPMLADAMAQKVAAAGGLGLAQPVMQALLHAQEGAGR